MLNLENKVIFGNNIEVLKNYPDNYFDAIVTDAPYGLGKEPNAEEVLKSWVEVGYHEIKGTGFMGKEWDAFVPQPLFWKEVYRVLKHGGHVLSFFGTRTYDWGVMAMRLAGFEVRDKIDWHYGSGFPKSHNISKAIDKMGGESLDWFIDYILKIAEERGISKKELTMLFPSKNGNPTGWLWNKQNNQSITLEQYNKIKDYLKLPFENIEEAEREVIGKGKAGLTKGNIANFSGETEFDITTPSTEQAKQWDGWGSALKPASEPIVLARKPLEKGLSIAENVLKWGTGAINIDGCRVGTDLIKGQKAGQGFNNVKGFGVNTKLGDEVAKEYVSQDVNGRFPANLILTHHPECTCNGLKKVKGSNCSPEDIGKGRDGDFTNGIYGAKSSKITVSHTDENGEETVEDWTCHEYCPIRIMDEQSGISKSQRSERGNCINNNVFGKYKEQEDTERGHNDSGGASRFFYVAKASKSERNYGLDGFEEKLVAWSNQAKAELKRGNTEFADDTKMHNKVQGRVNFHPTVKPVKLMQYLVRLITPPNGIVLDPFCGSGTTGIACKLEGFNFVGIDITEEYCQIAEARIANYVEEEERLVLIEKEEEENTDNGQLDLFS